ncbi:MAG TPA: NAD(P)-binding domain-containing protein [Candidatus Thermoplasmatota archaeon]|nr:NAD(P)-binding domain-containing protein [Candidatus Thermoplasmatota archaeon]
MRVGIIGSGSVGQTLAKGFAAKGHDVVLGTRDPLAALKQEKPSSMGAQPLGEFAKANPGVRVASFEEAARHAEVAVLCVHGSNVEEALRRAGPANLAGKLVLDTTNPIEFTPKGAHKPASIPDSCIQVAQRAAPQARFVKAWNMVPGGQMVDPRFSEGQGDILVCGDDAGAKQEAARLLASFGWRTADVGGTDMGPYVEGAALAVINFGARTNDWGWGIRLVGRR